MDDYLDIGDDSDEDFLALPEPQEKSQEQQKQPKKHRGLQPGESYKEKFGKRYKKDPHKLTKTRYRVRRCNGTYEPRKINPQSWERFLGLIASGIPKSKALHRIKVEPAMLELWFSLNVAALKQYREARTLGLRKRWPMDVIEQAMDKILIGNTVKAALAALGFEDERDYTSFMQLIHRDPKLREWYDETREMQAENFLDGSIDIADENDDDWYKDDKGRVRLNHEAINRSKLRVETRQWTMGVLNRKRFGNHKHIDLDGNLQVDHVATLTGARRRIEDLDKQRRAVIDNDTGKVLDS